MINLAASSLALVAVLILAYFVIKGGAMLNGMKHRKGLIQIIESAPIGSRERAVVVRYNNRQILLGVTAQSVNVIDSSEYIEQPSVD